MEYRVYLDNVLLKNIPLGINNLKKNFIRDNDLFGIYSVNSYDLIFVGDGYCIMKDFQENVNSCNKELIIQRKCNGVWEEKFNGIIEVGSVKLNEELSQANCEIQDNSPLSLISRNAEVTIDMETIQNIFGGAITPANIYSTTFDGLVSGTYTGKYLLFDEALKLLLEAITGKDTTVSSTFLTTTPTDCVWELVYTGNMNDIIDTTITYKNFQGETKTIVANFATGNAHFLNVRHQMITASQFIANTNGNAGRTLQLNMDFRDFYFTSQDNATKTITLNANLPIEIISVAINSFDVTATISFSKLSDYSDGGNYPCITNYNLLKNQSSPYLFTTTFKEVMTELNKLYNVFFIASYNSSGDIIFRVEDYDYFSQAPINFIFDNAKDLIVEFDEDTASSQIRVGESDSLTLATRTWLFTSEFCGIGKQFGANLDFVIGANRIYNDFAETFDDGKEDIIYILENAGVTPVIQCSDGNQATLVIYPINYFNLYSTNWHQIYRHFNKFRGDVIGNKKAYFSVEEAIYVENISINRFFKTFTFSDIMTQAQFESLSDDIIDKAKFKRQKETIYREGLIQSIEYNEETGEASITILGR